MAQATDSMATGGAVVVNQYHSHEHFRHDPRMRRVLDELAAVRADQGRAATLLEQQGAAFMALVEEFRASIAEIRTARESMAESFRVFREKLDAALADDADQAAFRSSVQALRDELDSESDALVGLALANTEAAPPAEEPPAEEPAIDPAAPDHDQDPDAPTA